MAINTRSKAISLLEEVCVLSPDIRLGQLLAHLGFLGESYLGRDLGDIDDDELTAILERHKAELEARYHDFPTKSPLHESIDARA